MKKPARLFSHLFLAVTFLTFPCPVFQPAALAADKPVADITRTLNFHEGYSATPNPEKNYEAFDFEADLGVIAGITKDVMDRAFDGAGDADIMPGSGTVTLGSVANSAGNLVMSLVPKDPLAPDPGPKTIDTLRGQTMMTTSNQSADSPQNLTLKPANQSTGSSQIVVMSQNGQAVTLPSNQPVVPPGAAMITISQGTPAAVTTPETATGTAVVVTPEQAAQGQMISFQVPAGSGGSGGGETVSVLNSEKFNYSSGRGTSSDNLYQLPHAPELKVGAKINAGVFNAGDANKEFKSAVDIRWSPVAVSANAQKTLDRVPIGKLRAHTTKFEFKRQLGWGLHLKLSLEWMNKWYNDIVEYSPSDVDMNIDDKGIEKLGSTVVNHADVIDPFPINPVALVGTIAAKLGAKGLAVTAAKTLGEKIFGKLSIGVTAEQNTYDRTLEVTLSATGKDIEGNTVSLLAFGEDGSTTIRMDQETNEYPIFVAIPREMKPINQVTVKIADAVYKYKEGGNVALGVSCYGISFPTNTGRLTSWIGKIFNEDHVISTDDKPDFTVPIEPMIQVPFHGIVETGDPRTGLEGATVNLMKENRVFKTTTTDAAGRFYDDFTVLGSQSAAMLALPMQAVKKGYPIQESIKAPANFEKTDDGYRIYLPPDLANSMSVYGPVTDINDKPIAGAEVILSGVEQQMVVSQANGAYQFNQVPRCDQFTLHVNKSGYYFEPVTYNRKSNEAGILVPLKAAIAQQSRKSIKLALMPMNGAPLPGYVSATHADGKNHRYTQTAGAFFIPVNGMSDTLTLSQEGYTFTPSSVTAQFSGDLSDTEEKSFNVAALPLWTHAVTLTAGPATIETWSGISDSRAEETGRATAKVVNAVNEPIANVSVRFTDTGDDAHTGLAFANEQNGNGYAFTDATGTAAVNFTAHGLGKITVLATALDHYMVTGNVQDEVKSNSVELTAVANTRFQNPKKPTASVTTSADQKGITTQNGSVKIETGGKVKFQFSSALGNSPAGGAPLPGDSFTGFKLVFYRFNQQIGEEVYASTPWPSVIREFAESGTYKISFQVKEKYYENEIWSDPAEATFEVEELRPPEVTLTIPNTTGTVNLPVDWSFGVLGYATLKNVILQFGDNKQDINLDAGLLTGKKTWSGSYFHTYDAEGTYTVLLRATDVNNKTAETTKTVTIGSIAALNDHTAPTGTVLINSGGSTTSSRTVVLHITGSDNSGGSGVFRMRLSNDGTTWNNWNYVSYPDDRPLPSVTMDYAWQVSDSGGNKTVYVQLKDAAENVSSSFSDSITYANAVSVSGATGDGASPGIYPGNDQAMYTWDHQAPTGSISVTAVNGTTASVALTMSDGGTAPHPRMCFSANGSTWTAWEEFVSSKDIGLDSGQTKVYVKYVDGVGNVSTAYSADIPAQGNAPAAQAQAPAAPGAPPAEMMGPPVGDAMVPNAMVPGGMPGGPGMGGMPGMPGMPGGPEGPGGVGMAPVEPVVPQTPAAEETPAEPGADWTVEKLGLSQKPEIGKKMFIMVGLKAVKGTGKGSADLTFRPEGGMAETKKIPLEGKTKEDVRFDWEPSKPGKTELFLEVRSDGDPDPSNNTTREMIDVEGRAEKGQGIVETAQGNATVLEAEVLGEQKLEQAGMEGQALIEEGREEVKDGKRKAGFLKRER